MHPIIKQIREDLKATADQQAKDNAKRFFKEAITCYGVKSVTVTKFSRENWFKIENLLKKRCFCFV
jgi:3-methyladenine DNA glycosylase AlkD